MVELLLFILYVFKNPTRLAREWGIVYGETPRRTLDQLASTLELCSDDLLYEIGCGTGRAAFHLQRRSGCAVVGLDRVFPFIARARLIARILRRRRIAFYCRDMCDADYSRATVVYLTGTCMEQPEIELLCEALQTLPPAARILSVSFPLSDYDERFTTVKQIPARFPWGETLVYCNVRAISAES